MKISCYIAICLIGFASPPAFGQDAPKAPLPPPQLLQRPPSPPPGSTDFSTRLQSLIAGQAGTPVALTKFNLDFRGGTPRQLVEAIQQASGKPLNAIIPEEFASTELPALKVNNVTAPQLFRTLHEGSLKYGVNANGDRQVTLRNYGFTTVDNPPSDDSLWAFSDYTRPLFSLDFPGGTPKELVQAIQRASGKPLNAIIPEALASMKLPPLKMNNVDVPQLFQALQMAGSKTEAYVTGSGFGGGGGRSFQNYQQMVTSYGFKTSGTPGDDSIWYFYAERPNFPTLSPVKISRFYSLAPYLDRGLTVDDITTAVQTGWKMLGYMELKASSNDLEDKQMPAISFHKETKLLIAVGEADKLEVIDSVLKALDSVKAKPQPVPAAKPKTGE